MPSEKMQALLNEVDRNMAKDILNLMESGWQLIFSHPVAGMEEAYLVKGDSRRNANMPSVFLLVEMGLIEKNRIHPKISDGLMVGGRWGMKAKEVKNAIEKSPT